MTLMERLYSCMLKSRMIEERARLLQTAGKLVTPYNVVIGQEATEIGTTVQLCAWDTIAPSRHNLFTFVASNAPLRDALSPLLSSKRVEFAATAETPHAPRVITPLADFAAQLNIATGVALANASAPLKQKQAGAVLAFAADNASPPDVWRESLALAGTRRLPLVYVLENTHWSANGTSRRVARKNEALLALADSAGVPCITVDGNDVVAVYRVAHEALHRSRLRRGPTFINAQTSPWRKSSVTDAARPRTADEIEHWQGRDPLAHMEMYMTWYGVWSNDWKKKLVEAFSREIKEALVELRGRRAAKH